MQMKTTFLFGVFSIALFTAAYTHATGLATCDSGPRESWQPQDKLEKLLLDRGWKIRRIKEDGGCFEVYAFDEKGDRVEAYFHPKTLDLVPTSRDPRK
ncbi:MAG: PepSY domain-containing protein [Burkholderiales bacterium]